MRALTMIVLALILGYAAFIWPCIRFARPPTTQDINIQLRKLAMAIDTYYIDTGNLPSKLDELLSGSNGTNGWDGPYIKDSELKDPWDQPFQFKSPGEHGPYDIMSYGADRKSGGDGRDADIGNWMS